MPIGSRLLGSTIILASIALTSGVLAENPVALNSAANNNDLPFDNQSVPSATTNETVISRTPVAAESRPQQPVNNRCASTEKNFQKSLLVTAFPRLRPTSSSPGALSDVEHQLPELISQQLMAKHNAITPVQLNESLPSPASSNDNLLAQQIQKLARTQRTQLVLSGDIIDMDMTHPEATYSPGLYRRFVNGLFDFIDVKTHFDKRERVFSFNLNLRDGYTGQTLFSKRYDTYGAWGSRKEIGFGTPLFWKSDYGQQIKGLINVASAEVGDVVQCQPFMAQIDSRAGQTQILLEGGANNGLHSGDTLALYQLVVKGSETEYQQHQVRLVNRNATIELREVYPSHSIGVISGTNYLTGQFLAVSP